MRKRAMFWGLLIAVAIVGWSARSAQASPITYELVSGTLTAVDINGNEMLLTLGYTSGVALSDASATVDWDLAMPELSNLFVEASSVGFSLQSATPPPIKLDGAGGSYTLQAAPVVVTFDGLTLTGLDMAGSTIEFDPADQGLHIVMTGLALGGSQLLSVKIDFDFIAQAQSGVTAIPEPGSDLLFPAGLLMLGLIFRAQRREATC